MRPQYILESFGRVGVEVSLSLSLHLEAEALKYSSHMYSTVVPGPHQIIPDQSE